MIADKQAPASQQEAALNDYVDRLIKHSDGRRMLHLRMSALQPLGRQTQRLHIAALAFEPLITGFEGALFRLSNDDMVVFCKNPSAQAIDHALNHLKDLYAADPVIRDAGENLEGFCQTYDLAKSYNTVVEFARAAQAAVSQPALSSAPESQPPEMAGRVLDGNVLAKIQAAVAQADLTNMIRRQPVCAVVPGKPPRPVFSEVFTSMAALREILTPDVDIHGNRWLFQDLTTHLDRRVIAFLGHKDDKSLSKSFSINLNVASLASPEFLAFDRKMTGDARQTVVVELQLIDILADLEAFMFNRAFLRERNYKICLDGLTYQSLPLVNTGRLGVDLVKVIWSPEFHESVMRKDSDIIEAVKAIDPKRIILIRCDDERVFETGKALGTTLYQGYLIDRMLKPAQVMRSA